MLLVMMIQMHQQNLVGLCSSVQRIIGDYRKVPICTELYRAIQAAIDNFPTRFC